MGENRLNKSRRGLYSSIATISLVSILTGACSAGKSEEILFPTSTYTQIPATETFVPTDTETSVPPTDTPEPTATPEKTTSLVNNLEQRVNEIRAARAEHDVDYLDRINLDVSEQYVANILFLGKKEAGYGPPDAYIVMSIKDNLEIDVTSIPRDLYTPESLRRINSYNGIEDGEKDYGWHNNLIQPSLIPLIENITGLPIDYYLFLTSENLIVDMADSLGGIDFIPDTTMYNDKFKKTYLEGEKYTISGDELAYFVKMRKADSADMRMERQMIVGKAMFRQLLGNLKSKPLKTIAQVWNMYNLMKDYQDQGMLDFNTSSAYIDQSLSDMTSLGVSMLGDAARDRLNMPIISKTVNVGNLGLYRSWSDTKPSDEGYSMREYRSTMDEKYFLNTYIILSTRPDGTTHNIRYSKDMLNLVNNLYTNPKGLDYPTMDDLELALATARREYYAPLREKIAEALLEE